MFPLFQRLRVKSSRRAGAVSTHDAARFLRATAVRMKRSPIRFAAGSIGTVFSFTGIWTLPGGGRGAATFGLVQTSVTIAVVTPATRRAPPNKKSLRWNRGDESREAMALMGRE